MLILKKVKILFKKQLRHLRDIIVVYTFIQSKVAKQILLERIIIVISIVILLSQILSLYLLGFSFLPVFLVFVAKVYSIFLVFVRSCITLYNIYNVALPEQTTLKKDEIFAESNFFYKKNSFVGIKFFFYFLTCLKTLVIVACFIHTYDCYEGILIGKNLELLKEIENNCAALKALLIEQDLSIKDQQYTISKNDLFLQQKFDYLQRKTSHMSPKDINAFKQLVEEYNTYVSKKTPGEGF